MNFIQTVKLELDIIISSIKRYLKNFILIFIQRKDCLAGLLRNEQLLERERKRQELLEWEVQEFQRIPKLLKSSSLDEDDEVYVQGEIQILNNQQEMIERNQSMMEEQAQEQSGNVSESSARIDKRKS